MEGEYDNFTVEATLPDTNSFIRSLEFLSKIYNNLQPLSISFTPKGIMVDMVTSQEKKKTINGYTMKALLMYQACNIPDYQFFSSIKGELHRCFTNDDKSKISFGLDGTVISTAFPKNSLKNDSLIRLFSKLKSSLLYYNKDNSNGEYTLKTVVGYIANTHSVPIIRSGKKEFSLEEAINNTPTVCLTSEDFNVLCGGIKTYEEGALKIEIYKRGVKFFASEYGNPDKNFTQSEGLESKVIDTILMDAKFFGKIYGQLDKFSPLRSPVHLYFGRDIASGAAMVTILIKVGNSPTLLLQKEIIE